VKEDPNDAENEVKPTVKSTKKGGKIKEEPADAKEDVKKSKKGPAKSTKAPKEVSVRQAVPRTLVKKGRAAVDSHCGVAEEYHVYEDGDDIWDCMLNQTNIQFNNNKYYLIQLLEHDSGNTYSVWMRWGRVGATGQSCLKPCGGNLEQAKQIFRKKFSDKTLNDWEAREFFEKEYGKYDLVHMDYSDTPHADVVDAPKPKEPKKQAESQLEENVRKLIELICNVRMMEEAMVELKYDGQKAPLGKLTTEQIRAGYVALKAISDIVDSGKLENRALLMACNDFYTRIPHYFGMRVPPLIRSPEEVRAKLQLLEALGDIQAAMEVMGGPALDGRHPADRHYEGLKCDLAALPHTHHDYKLVSRYVAQNHGATHSNYRLAVEGVFACSKPAEQGAFAQSIGNRQLLWHGSRLSNWAGILAKGLKIAPPEAPSTGYMFGKGIYFADMCSKSANYCMANSANNTGLLVLCEVALGNSHPLEQADYEAGRHCAAGRPANSVHGLGTYSPGQASRVTMSDGVVVPLGPALKGPQKPLLYNEYIVYDVRQVRLRYLVKVRFDFQHNRWL